MSMEPEHNVTVGPDELAAARARVSPELLARLDAQTDADIVAQIAADPDAAPELGENWFACARLVRPLKAAE